MKKIILAGYKCNYDESNDRLYAHELSNKRNNFVIVNHHDANTLSGQFKFTAFTCEKPFSEQCLLVSSKWELVTEKGKDIGNFFNKLSHDNQIKPRDLKKELIERYPNEGALGVYYADYESDIKEADIPESEVDNYDVVSKLPGGISFSKCTNSANLIASHYPDCSDVYGFAHDDNLTCTHDDIVGMGHDFCVVAQRYIVDPWISHYTGSEEQYVYDLEDKSDHAKIKEIFGDPACWSILSDIFIKPGDPNYPEEKKITLKTECSVQLTM